MGVCTSAANGDKNIATRNDFEGPILQTQNRSSNQDDLSFLVGEKAELSDHFQSCAFKVKTMSTEPDLQTKLRIYGLFKQATQGPSKFSFSLDPVTLAKGRAWSSLGNMSKEKAMEEYIALVGTLFPSEDNTYNKLISTSSITPNSATQGIAENTAPSTLPAQHIFFISAFADFFVSSFVVVVETTKSVAMYATDTTLASQEVSSDVSLVVQIQSNSNKALQFVTSTVSSASDSMSEKATIVYANLKENTADAAESVRENAGYASTAAVSVLSLIVVLVGFK